MKKVSRNHLIIKNYLRRYNEIKSDVQFQYGDHVIFDVDSEEYSDLLSIDIIISNLLEKKEIDDRDFRIIELFKDGYTYQEIGEVVGLSRQIVSKKLDEAIAKISKIFFNEE